MEFVIAWILEIRTDLRIISKSIPKSVNYGFDGFGIRQIRNPSGPSVYTE